MPLNRNSGRQTLGSDHDGALGPQSSATIIVGPSDADEDTSPVWWKVFKDRVLALDSEPDGTARRLIRHFDDAWRNINDLGAVCHRLGSARNQTDPGTSQLVRYVQTEVVDGIARCAESAARAFQHSQPSVVLVITLADRWDMSLTVAALAVQADNVPPLLASAVRAAAKALPEWGAETGILVSALVRRMGAP